MTVAAIHAALNADGFTIHPALLAPPEIAALRDCFDHLLDRQVPTTTHVLYTHAAPASSPPSFDRLMTQWMNPHLRTGPGGTGAVLVTIGARLRDLGFGVRVFQDVLLSKRERHEPFPWHQDEPFWPFAAEAGLVVWCALDPVDRSNGGLELARGSHLLGRGPAIDLHTGEPQVGVAGSPTAVAALEGENLRLQPGDAVIFRPRTWHRSGRNTSGAPRRAWSTSWLPIGSVVQPELAPRHPLAQVLP